MGEEVGEEVKQHTVTFNVIRLTRGPHKGEVWILPNCRRGGNRTVNGRCYNRPQLRAQGLLFTVSFEAAFWFALGLLQGENGKQKRPNMKCGRSKHWTVARRSM